MGSWEWGHGRGHDLAFAGLPPPGSFPLVSEARVVAGGAGRVVAVASQCCAGSLSGLVYDEHMGARGEHLVGHLSACGQIDLLCHES